MRARAHIDERQLRMDFTAQKAANSPRFTPVAPWAEALERLAERIQAEDRLRLLEPTSLPKELRGYKRRPRPKTAIIAYAAQAAYERRIQQTEVIQKFLGQHAAKLRRLADRLRAT